MFKRKRFWIPAALIFTGIVSFMLLKPTPPSEPVKIYKAVPLPARKAHMLKTDTPTQDREIDDQTPETASTFGGPSESPSAQTTDSTDMETALPHDWYKTEDPELHALYFYAQLLKQFGDIPEVRVLTAYNLNVAKGVPQTLEELETYLQANYNLFPNEKNRRALNDFQQIHASQTTP